MIKHPSTPKFMSIPSHDEMEIHSDDYNWVNDVGVDDFRKIVLFFLYAF